jgi:hypothetical protein
MHLDREEGSILAQPSGALDDSARLIVPPTVEDFGNTGAIFRD